MVEYVESHTVITEEILQELLRFLKEKGYLNKLKNDMYYTFRLKGNGSEGINTFDIRKYAFEYKKTVGEFLKPVKGFGIALIEFNYYLQWKTLNKTYQLVKQFENKILYNEKANSFYFITKVTDYKNDKNINHRDFIIVYNVLYIDFEARSLINQQQKVIINGLNTSCFGKTLKTALETYKVITDEELASLINDVRKTFIKSIEENVNTAYSELKKPYNDSKPCIEYIKSKYINNSTSFYYAYDSKDIVYSIKTPY